LGINTYGIRACAAVRDNERQLAKTVKELLVILTCSTTIVFGVYCICLFAVPRVNQDRTLFTVYAIALWLASFGVEWFYQALEQYGYITIRNIAVKTVGLILMFVFVHERNDYVVYGAITVFSAYGANIFNIIRLRKLVNLKLRVKLEIKRHFKPMFWFFVANTSSGIYTQADIVSLGFLSTTNVVGIYQLVAKVKTVFIAAVNSVGTVLLPRLTYYRAKSKEKQIDQLVAKNINFVAIVSGAVIAVSFICAQQIVLLLGGGDFLDSAMPLRVVSPAVAFSAFNIVLANYLISASKEKEWAVINFVGVVIAVTLNLLLIPSLGAVGAALSTSCCELSVLVMRSILCRHFLRQLLPSLDLGRISVCAGASAFLTFLISTHVIPSINSTFIDLLVQTAVFSVIYGLLLVLVHEKFVSSYTQKFFHRKHA
jgi:O-antigen/teichoic acid export membrane protein